MDEKNFKLFSIGWFLHNNIIPLVFTGMLALIGTATYLGNLAAKADTAQVKVEGLQGTQNLLNQLISEKMQELDLAQKCSTVMGASTSARSK